MHTIVRCPRTGRACSEVTCRERHWRRKMFERGLSHRGLPLKRKFRPRCWVSRRNVHRAQDEAWSRPDPLRGILFAVVTDPHLIVAIQALDGVSAAVLGVVLPLVVADITRGTGRFNLGLGIVGSAVGIGAAFSTTLGGYAMDHFGRTLAFSSLATIAACGLALLWLLPETRRVVGALASAAQTAPSLKSERKRSRLSANWDARADSARSISNPTIATTRA